MAAKRHSVVTPKTSWPSPYTALIERSNSDNQIIRAAASTRVLECYSSSKLLQ